MVQAEPKSCGGAIEPSDGLTVHLVGRLTPAVLSFLLPAVRASLALGRRQALLCINDEVSERRLASIPADVHRIDVRNSDYRFLRCDALFKALQHFSRNHKITVVHAHGLLPVLAAARFVRDHAHRGVKVLFSPHSSRIFGWQLATHAIFGSKRLANLGNDGLRVIANVQREARLLAPFGGVSVQVLDCPVPRVFFDTPRAEARRPRVISCNLEFHKTALDGFQRAAVLLNDDRLGIEFNWIGNPSAYGFEALRAAGVACFEASTSSFRADRFSTAWLYVAACEERGFPIHLAEAMAAGLPCVALDSETHRGMIVPGETGFLYGTVREMLSHIGQLVDSPELRQRLGQAARRQAELRFQETDFQRNFWNSVSFVPTLTTPELQPGNSAAKDQGLPQ